MVAPSAVVDGMPIWVLDSFLPQHLHQLVARYAAQSNYQYGHGSNDTSSHNTGRLVSMLTGSQTKELPLYDAFVDFCKTVKQPQTVQRAYINMSFVTTGNVEHVDDDREGLTLLYYANTDWSLPWGGETLFFTQDQEIGFASVCKPNRAIVFDSRLLHSARHPSALAKTPRYTVTYKGLK